MIKKFYLLITFLFILSACTPAIVSVPTPTTQPTNTFTPSLTSTSTITPTISPTPTQINISNASHQIIKGAYEYYYENRETIRRGIFPDEKLVDMSPHNGIHWPYLLYEPEVIKSKNILVKMNNTPFVDDTYSTHLQRAIDSLHSTRREADEIGSVLIIPIFPRFSIPKENYGSQGLSRFDFITEYIEIRNPDLQLLAMVDEVISYYKKEGISLSEKLLFTGYSGESWFSSRFTVLHSSRVQAVAAGGINWALVPLNSFDNFDLYYPFGISDIEDYDRIAPDVAHFENVHIYIYSGSLDGYSKDESGWVFEALSGPGLVTISSNPHRDFFLKFGVNKDDLFNSNKIMLESVSSDNLVMDLLPGLDHGGAYNENYEKGVDFLKEHAEYF